MIQVAQPWLSQQPWGNGADLEPTMPVTLTEEGRNRRLWRTRTVSTRWPPWFWRRWRVCTTSQRGFSQRYGASSTSSSLGRRHFSPKIAGPVGESDPRLWQAVHQILGKFWRKSGEFSTEWWRCSWGSWQEWATVSLPSLLMKTRVHSESVM